MQHIICSIITNQVKQLASELGVSDTYANNLINTWRTLYNKNITDFPNKKDVLDLHLRDKENIQLAVPKYEKLPFEENSSLAFARNGTIYLRKIFDEKPLEYFFDYITGKIDSDTSKQKQEVFRRLADNGYPIDKIRELISSPTEAYRFLLWHEMSHIEFNDSANYYKIEREKHGGWDDLPLDLQAELTDYLTEDKIEIEYRATLEALKKAETWRKSHPIQYISNVEDSTQTKTSYSEYRENLELVQSQESQIDSESDIDGTPLVGINHINVKLDSPRDKANRAFNITTRQDRVNLLSRQFSDVIDVLQEEFIEEINDKLVSARTDNNIEAIRLLEEELALLTDKENGRKAIVEKATVSEIINRLKEQWQYYSEQSVEELDKNFEGRGEYISSEYNKVLEHFDILLEDAALDIENREGIRIIFEKIKYHNGSETKDSLGGIVQKDNTQEENDSDENNENDGERVNNSDGFGYKARFINPHSTLSKEVKRVLGTLVKENEYSGEPEVDDLGNFRYIDSAHAHAVLLSALYDMVDADDFSIVDENKEIISLPALEKAAERYPWISQVIEAIELDNNLASKFYTDLRKEFIVYWGHREGKTIEYNGTTVVDDTMQNVTYDYEKGIKHSKNSLYNADKSINIDNASLGITKSDDIISDLKDGDIELLESKINDIIEVFRMLGFNPTAFTIQSLLQSEDGIAELISSLQTAKEIFEGSKESSNVHLINEYQNFYEIIANSVGHLSETGGIASFKVGNKTLYSYSAPNYIDGMIKKFKNDSKREQYLQSEFKYDKWFYEDGKWKNKWLEQIENDEEVRANLRTIDLYNLEGDYYTEWDNNRIYHGFIKQYFATGYNPNSSTQFAWYNFPIFSDSPVVKFIKGVRYTENVKETIIPLLADVVEQELGRIRHVQERRAKGVPQISNYDKTGDRFHFFPQLNNYTRISDGRNFMQTLLEMTESKDLSEKREFIETTLQEILEDEFSNFYIKVPKSIKEDIINEGYASEETVQEKIEEYFYNHYFATSQIIQLTTTDLAFYKDDKGVDFQKRFKEVYASGNRLNTNSKYGKKVERTIYIKDEIIQSLGFDNIKSILDQAVKDKKLSSLDRDFLLTQYENVNVTDAQAFRSLDSYRSILDMMGKWTKDMEKTFERIQKDEWDMTDFNIVWQTIKPFVFTNMRKPDGLGGFMRVPHQHKNSEFLLTAMYHMFSKRLSESPKLRAINQFMHDNNIDVAQFDSAVKVGGQGVIDLSNIDSYDAVTKELNKYCFENGNINPVVVHEVSYDDYMVQQPTPEHLMDTVAIYGSQFRNLIVSDMPDTSDFRVTVNDKDYTKQELLSLYQSLIVENLLDSYESLKDEIGYNDIDKLQKLLLKQVKGNPKYGRDIIDALQIIEVINPVTKLSQRVFNIPLSNPTTTTQIQELINSLFKNRITKQEIKGGNCILVSSVGLTKELQILYNEDGSVKGVECYMPAYSKQFYETLLDEKTGELKYNKLPEELKKLVGYRIPTEGKYSMLPLYIKGFLPQQNGSAIMLPADITTISGADFDVKLY